jgi:hypothetical protein
MTVEAPTRTGFSAARREKRKTRPIEHVYSKQRHGASPDPGETVATIADRPTATLHAARPHRLLRGTAAG